MSELILKLRVPFTQEYYPPRARRPNRKSFWSDGFVEIREIAIKDLRPAYRILPAQGCGSVSPSSQPYVVSSFEDGCWWPLLEGDDLVSASDFIERAGVGDRTALHALGVRFEFAGPEPWDEFFGNGGFRLGASTRDEQWSSARHGARRVIVCDGRVLVEAGEPIYYLVPPWRWMRCGFEAGPAPLSRTDGGDYRLPGPAFSQRLDCARKGFAFGIDETDAELERLQDGPNDGFRSNIEVLSDRRPGDFAARHCASAFIDLLWLSTKIPDSPRAAFSRRALPILGSQKEFTDVRCLSQHVVLNELISMEEHGYPENFAWLKSDAAELLRRLGPPPLSPEEDDWISRLGP